MAEPQILINSFGELAVILQTVSVLMGLGLFMTGLFELKRYGEMRTMMSHQMTIAKPALMILCGVIFLILPTFLATGLVALWGTSSPLAYHGNADGYAEYIPPLLMFVRLIGAGSIMRGIVLFARAGGQGGQPGTMGKAMVHVIGGLCALHILGTEQILSSILGLN